MPLIIPKELPAYGELSRENVFVMHQQRAQTQQIRPLRILILNLMPTKIVTETQLARLLANSPLQVQLTFLQTKTHDTLRSMMDKLRDKEPNAVGALIGTDGGKTTLAVGVGKNALARGLKAGALVKQIAAIAGGNGGGKPDFAMAGIRDTSKIDDALNAVEGIVKENLEKAN